ncbi:hypothetical protein D9758_006132 [Tetrapyrgos nigripes]|uniref:DUF6589 domain-containing protein n=1 Tax=Tetrapyrgos nigripes TaxID=182062 RepID=A0A8H5LL40_9AGAR|nr:hypothetical protein D9758_006132 [Tetrapyrgos nigripes]
MVCKHLEILGYVASCNLDEPLHSSTMLHPREGRVDDLRWARKMDGEGYGDMVFENAILFLRDALISREFTDAVKAGDSGRILLILKIWAFSFRGNGRTKYAYEMFRLVHNLTSVWPEEVRNIILNNWLINTTGKENSFLEVGPMQEHLNFWIKVIYKAHGSNSSWEWLDMITPCIAILREIARTMNGMLGGDIGSNHKAADLTNDIDTLMTSLGEYNVYRLQQGRVLNEDEVVNDVILTGLQMLTDAGNNPLDDYNTAFKNLQKRRRMRPVTTDDEEHVVVEDSPLIPEFDPNAPQQEHNSSSNRNRPQSPLTRDKCVNDSTETSSAEMGAADGSLEGDCEGIEPETSENDVLKVLMDIEAGEREPTLLLTTEEDVALEDEDESLEGEEDEDTDGSDVEDEAVEVSEESGSEDEEDVEEYQK